MIKLHEITHADSIARLCSPTDDPILCVSWSDGEIEIYGRHESQRNTWSPDEHHGHCTEWVLPKVDARGIRSELEDCAEAIQAAADEYSSEWINGNAVAVFADGGDAKRDAIEAIQAALYRAEMGEDGVWYWEPAEWFGFNHEATADAFGITTSLGEQEIDRIGCEMAESVDDWHVLLDPDDCAVFAAEIQDELRQEEEEDEDEQEEDEQEPLDALLDELASKCRSHTRREICEALAAGEDVWILDTDGAGKDDVLIGDRTQVIEDVEAHRGGLEPGWSLTRIRMED